jgi:hypothetical protein
MKKNLLIIKFNIALVLVAYALSYILWFTLSGLLTSIFTRLNIYTESVISFQFGNFLCTTGVSFLTVAMIHYFKIKRKQSNLVSNIFEIIYLIMAIYHFALFIDYVSTNSLPQWLIW